MAEEPGPGSLPQYYGERLKYDSIVEHPSVHKSDSRDALLRLPIQQPNKAHLDSHMMPPASLAPHADGLGLSPGQQSRSASKRSVGGQGRYITYPDHGDEHEYGRHSHRYEPYPENRGPFVEEYYEDDYSRAYRRPICRYSRPPLSYQKPHSRYQARFSGDGQRASVDSGGEYEPDNPIKPRVHYHYGSEDEPSQRDHYYPSDGGAGSKGATQTSAIRRRCPPTPMDNVDEFQRKES
ncbi:hypothetical protein CC78DRAFT_576371 [Lojkania enalia]|uniref:Uncharacterized protein n=1 Tax=Lojkania enalia TaxID=147567 RepID=A0A9P4N961_9PLEO|nr:hypothetical protein CC78DRAFT_576371 [Didymosphaeria enalia]